MTWLLEQPEPRDVRLIRSHLRSTDFTLAYLHRFASLAIEVEHTEEEELATALLRERKSCFRLLVHSHLKTREGKLCAQGVNCSS